MTIACVEVAGSDCVLLSLCGFSACESVVAWLGLFSASATFASGLVESGLASGAGS